MPEGGFNLGWSSGGFIPDPGIWYDNSQTPNGQPSSGVNGGGGGGSCDIFCQLIRAASGAFTLYEQNDLASEAYAHNSSIQFGANGKVLSAGGINIGQYLPLILLLVGVVLVFKLIG